MKNASKISLGFMLAFGVTASADQGDRVHLSKTYAFPVASLEKVEAAMQTAAARTGDSKKLPVSYVIDATEHSSVVCAADAPDMYQGRLYGCILQFVIDIGSGTKLTASHMLYLSQSSKDVNDLLSKTDPNGTARVSLNVPFDGGGGSAYYCNAEGASGAKTWGCYLDLVD